MVRGANVPPVPELFSFFWYSLERKLVLLDGSRLLFEVFGIKPEVMVNIGTDEALMQLKQGIPLTVPSLVIDSDHGQARKGERRE
jgi:hypothetical protein